MITRFHPGARNLLLPENDRKISMEKVPGVTAFDQVFLAETVGGLENLLTRESISES